MFILVRLCCRENANARHIFPPIPHIHLIFWPVNLKCIYRHSDSLTTHTLICIWLCIHAWGPLKGEAFCVRALDVMRGGNSGTEPVWWPHTATGRGRHPSGNSCCEDVSAGVFVMYPPISRRWPTSYWLNRNWTQKPIIALCCCAVLIQGLVRSVGPWRGQRKKGVNG